jgi:adenylate kinase
MNILFMGPPGAGKGTQAERIVDTFDIPHISTGDAFRLAMKQGTPLGKKAKEFVDQGLLVPDEITNGIVRERLQLEDCNKGFLLDGFPRTIPQAESLDRIIAGRAPLIIVDIVLSEADVIRRLASRMVCAECGANAVGEGTTCHDCGGPLVPRADDREQVVLNRLQVYREQTEPLVRYYGERPTYCRIDGARLADDVTKDIIRDVEKRRR